jgi:hypothetical protein
MVSRDTLDYRYKFKMEAASCSVNCAQIIMNTANSKPILYALGKHYLHTVSKPVLPHAYIIKAGQDNH